MKFYTLHTGMQMVSPRETKLLLYGVNRLAVYVSHSKFSHALKTKSLVSLFVVTIC